MTVHWWLHLSSWRSTCVERTGLEFFPFLKPPTDGSFIRIKVRDVPSTDAHTKSFSHLAFMGMTPLEPTPTGIWSNIAWASCSFTGCTSLSSKFVRSKRTPQLMSNPTPPRNVGKAMELIKRVLVVSICWVFILNPCWQGACTKRCDLTPFWQNTANKAEQQIPFYQIYKKPLISRQSCRKKKKRTLKIDTDSFSVSSICSVHMLLAPTSGQREADTNMKYTVHRN